MLIQAMPLFTFNNGCSAVMNSNSQYNVLYQVSGASSKVSGVEEPMNLQGTIPAGTCSLITASGNGPFTVSVGRSGAASAGARVVVPSNDVIVTYMYVGQGDANEPPFRVLFWTFAP
jgi:hypothetical protein